MSRLGSRLLPESVARGLTDSGEESPEEGQALRDGRSLRSRPSVYHRRINSSSNAINQPEHETDSPYTRDSLPRRDLRRMFSLRSRSQMTPLQDTPAQSSESLNDPEHMSHQLQPFTHDIHRSGTRMIRFRNSFTTSIGALLGSSDRRLTRRLQPSSLQPSRTPRADESDELLNQPHPTRPQNESDESSAPEFDAVEPDARNILSGSRLTSGMSSIRRLPHGLRSRSTRLIRRGEHPPLTQVLQLAAAAIAAQLSGGVNPNENSAIANEGFDGSIQNFVQTLQEAASAQASQEADESADGELPPVNFMRVFQFPNDENGTPIAALPQGQRLSEELDLNNPDSADRSVTLVLVGVRSMPNIHDTTGNENGAIGPSLDTLLSLPFLPPVNVLRNGSSGALFRRSDTRFRPQNRRHSMTNFNFPQQYESQRHTRNRTATRASGETGPLTPPSESPPGPNPPPSTPADIRSGAATPIRRPSSASAAHVSELPDLEEHQDSSEPSLPAESAFNTARQRRRSDSEFARRPELSSGNARRNGMVEPDRPTSHAGRSWLIYVVGTNVAPDHPAFTMPSLFTDNPSYEDMQMLSTLLGPVKPPVASQEDVDAAGGVLRVEIDTTTGQIFAEPEQPQAGGSLRIELGDRCTICLCDYERNEVVRRMVACGHIYHRECIDAWLITGRNACAMCKYQQDFKV